MKIKIVANPRIPARITDRDGKPAYATNTFNFEITTTDQHAVFFGGMSVGDGETRKQYIVIIVPTLVDLAGKAIHSAEELPAPVKGGAGIFPGALPK
jgi:hypothetical protein